MEKRIEDAKEVAEKMKTKTKIELMILVILLFIIQYQIKNLPPEIVYSDLILMWVYVVILGSLSMGASVGMRKIVQRTRRQK